MRVRIAAAIVIFVSLLFAILAMTVTNDTSNRILGVATGQAYLTHPAPLPEFVSSVRIWDDPSKARLCLILWQGAFWKEGDAIEALQNHLVNTTNLTINGRIMGDKSVSIFGMYPRDSAGRITDKFGADIEFCYQLQLSEGIYTAVFETSSLDGQTVTYSWGIEVRQKLNSNGVEYLFPMFTR